MGVKSSLAVLEIILHVLCAACCIGISVASAVAFSAINDIGFLDNASDDSEEAEDRDRFRAVAWWLLAVAFAGIITQIVLLIIRTLFFKKIISQFVVFGILCLIFTILLSLALISGGIPSAINAEDVQERRNVCDEVGITESTQELCDDLERLRDSQICSAVLAFIGAGVGAVITVVVLVAIVISRDD